MHHGAVVVVLTEPADHRAGILVEVVLVAYVYKGDKMTENLIRKETICFMLVNNTTVVTPHKVWQRTRLDVLPHYGHVVIPVEAGLFVVEAEGVVHLVHDGAVLLQAPIWVVDLLAATLPAYFAVAAFPVAASGGQHGKLRSSCSCTWLNTLSTPIAFPFLG